MKTQLHPGAWRSGDLVLFSSDPPALPAQRVPSRRGVLRVASPSQRASLPSFVSALPSAPPRGVRPKTPWLFARGIQCRRAPGRSNKSTLLRARFPSRFPRPPNSLGGDPTHFPFGKRAPHPMQGNRIQCSCSPPPPGSCFRRHPVSSAREPHLRIQCARRTQCAQGCSLHAAPLKEGSASNAVATSNIAPSFPSPSEG